MNKTMISFMMVLYCILFQSFVFPSQTSERKVPSADIKTLDGKTINTSGFSNKNKPILLCFWETTCKPCINELDAIAEVYADWQKATDVKVTAVSIDNARSSHQVPGIVNSKGWEYEVYTDINQDFKRAIGFSYCPFNCLIDQSGNIVWTSSSYSSGDEIAIYKLITKLSKGEAIGDK